MDSPNNGKLIGIRQPSLLEETNTLSKDDSGNVMLLFTKCQGHDQTDLQYQARGCGHSKVKHATGKAGVRGPGPHRKAGLDMWSTACDIQVDEGGRGAGRPKMTWKKMTEQSL